MELDLSKIYSLLVKKLKFIILIALITALLAFVYSSFFISERFTSTSKFLVFIDPTQNKNSEASFVIDAKNSYLEIFDTTNFFKEVADAYNEKNPDSKMTSSQIKSVTSIKASSSESAAFYIQVTTQTPELSYELARTISDCAINKSLYYTDLNMLNQIDLIDDPQFPVNSSYPNITQNTLLGFIIGAVISSFIFIIVYTLDVRVKTLSDITNIFNVSVLGVVPEVLPEATKSSKK